MNKFNVNEEQRNLLGKFIRKKRLDLELSQGQLAFKTGINNADIHRLEKGDKKKINPYYLKKVAEVLKLDYKKLYKMVDYLEKEMPLELSSNIKKIEMVKTPMYGTSNTGLGDYDLIDPLEKNFLLPLEDYREGRFTVKVEEDSMTGAGEKSIPFGTIALVDPIVFNNIEELLGKVCIFTYNAFTCIKELEIDEKKRILLVSFNPNIPDITVLNEDELKLEGRIIKTYLEQKW